MGPFTYTRVQVILKLMRSQALIISRKMNEITGTDNKQKWLEFSTPYIRIVGSCDSYYIQNWLWKKKTNTKIVLTSTVILNNILKMPGTASSVGRCKNIYSSKTAFQVSSSSSNLLNQLSRNEDRNSSLSTHILIPENHLANNEKSLCSNVFLF